MCCLKEYDDYRVHFFKKEIPDILVWRFTRIACVNVNLWRVGIDLVRRLRRLESFEKYVNFHVDPSYWASKIYISNNCEIPKTYFLSRCYYVFWARIQNIPVCILLFDVRIFFVCSCLDIKGEISFCAICVVVCTFAHPFSSLHLPGVCVCVCIICLFTDDDDDQMCAHMLCVFIWHEPCAPPSHHLTVMYRAYRSMRPSHMHFKEAQTYIPHSLVRSTITTMLDEPNKHPSCYWRNGAQSVRVDWFGSERLCCIHSTQTDWDMWREK